MVTIDVFDVVCVQLTRDLFAMAKFIFSLLQSAKNCGESWNQNYPIKAGFRKLIHWSAAVSHLSLYLGLDIL